jgi:WD40 repeat protein
MSLKCQLLQTINKHNSGVYAITNGFGDGRILSGSGDRFAVEWSIDTASQTGFAVKTDNGIFSLATDGDLQFLAIGESSGGLRIIDINSKQEKRYFTTHSKGIFKLLFNDEKQQMYSLGGDGMFHVWSVPEFELLRSIPLSEQKLKDAIFDKDKKHLIICGSDGYVRILELEYFNEVQTINAHQTGCNSLALHPTKPLLLTAGRDAHIRFWEIGSWNEQYSIAAHNFSIYSLKFSPDGSVCATASFDKTMKLWDSETFESPLRLDHRNQGHKASVNTVHWDTVTGYLCSGSDDKTIKIWKTHE